MVRCVERIAVGLLLTEFGWVLSFNCALIGDNFRQRLGMFLVVGQFGGIRPSGAKAQPILRD